MHLLYGGREHIIEQRLPDKSFQLKDLTTNQCEAITEERLVDALFDGQVELLGAGREYAYLKGHNKRTRVSDLTALADDDPRKKEARRRLAYIKEMNTHGRVKFTPEFLRPIIEKVGRVVGDMLRAEYDILTEGEQAELKEKGIKVQPSPTTLFRWFTGHEKAGRDIRVLVPAFKSQGNGKRKISDDEEKCEAVLRLIDKVIDGEYLTLERPSVQECYTSLVALIAKENERREEEDKLPTPHPNTLYKIVNKIDPYEKDLARHGQRIADANHRANKRGPRPKRPLERVEADDTKINLFVIDPERMMPLGRPWLIALIDVYTKMILGFYLSFVHPSYLSVMQSLLHAIRPKTYVREKYPNIKHTWKAYGIPRLLVVDNAKHWISADFDDACYQLNIETQYCPVKHPWYKTSIERWLGTQNRLFHALPGTTFSDLFDREDYDPQKHAVVSLELLEWIIHKWIIDVYQRRKHRGIKDVPLRRWEVGTDKFPPVLPPSAVELDVLLGHIERRVISKSGVEIFGLFYNDERLAPIRSALKEGEKVEVKYDPTEISMIHVRDEHNGRYIPVPAVDQEYTKGLSLWQHEVIKRHASKTADEYVDIVDLCLAKASIKEEVRKATKALSRRGTNVRFGRWLEDEKAGERRSSERANKVSGDGRKAKGRVGKSDDTVPKSLGNHPGRGASDLGSAVTSTPAQDDHKAEHSSSDRNTPTSRSRKRMRSGDKGRNKSANHKPSSPPQAEPKSETAPRRKGVKDDTDGWGFDYAASK
jgi:putative transposase